jgi:hypothetical protein
MLPFLLLASKEKKPSSHGYIYFLADEEAGLVKIGRTKNDPRLRANRIAGQSPHPLRLLDYFETDQMEKEEMAVHEMLRDCRRHGEWFDLECVSNKIFGEEAKVQWLSRRS